MNNQAYRVEKDSMGEMRVPADALYGAQTQRAVQNFPLSGLRMPPAFVRALALLKDAAAHANEQLGLLPAERAAAIRKAAQEIAAGKHQDQFPVDVFQTGSGTSSNMNANEVIARLASNFSKLEIHPNNDVNMGQSSNDVIPSAIHVSASLLCREELLPALEHLEKAIRERAATLGDTVKTGRTHLMDAMPLTLGQELTAWAEQLRHCRTRLEGALAHLQALCIGGTAVGTGINAPAAFGALVVDELKRQTGLPFCRMDNLFVGIASQDSAVEMSGQLKTSAVALMKIANDLRWMNSGPLAGLGEISLRPLQPGSSIMPGKVNPVVPEALCMICAQVIGNDTAITLGGQAGNFQLNVMLPLIAQNLLQSMTLLSTGARRLADTAIADFTVNENTLQQQLARNPILVTALNPVIGYEQGAAIAKRAYAEGRSVQEVAREMTDLSDTELARLLNPTTLTKGGLVNP